MRYENEIYIGTVLMEKNRWAEVRTPTISISDWTGRFKDEGFDGIELWQNHAFLADEEERRKLSESPVPVRIFNSYNRCEKETLDERKRAVEMVNLFSSEGMKYNFGRDAERHEEYCASVKEWRDMLPENFRFLCECHGGTTMQNPQKARDVFLELGLDDYEVIIHGMGGSDENLEKVFQIHDRHITHIHVNVSDWSEKGENFLQKRVDLLRELGFRGSYTIEFTEGIKEDLSVEQLFKNAARDMKMLRGCLK